MKKLIMTMVSGFVAIAAFVARAEAPNTQWTWTQSGTTVTLTEVTPEGYDPETYVPWKFNLTSAGVLSIATTVSTTGLTSPKINFRTIPEDCPYVIKSLQGKYFMSKDTAYYNAQSTAAATIIEEVYLPASLTTFNIYNFNGCSKLKVCDLPADNQVEKIDTNAFKGCTSLREFCLGPKVKTINGESNAGAFYNCTSLTLTGLRMPDSLETIQKQAFRGASSTLLSGRVVFGGDDSHGVTFDTYAFCSQASITELVFGAKVTNCGTTKGSAATPFAYCTGVTNFVSRNPDGFTFGSTTDSYLFNLNGLKQYDLAGWPRGKMVANVTYGKQTRILAPCDNLKWLGYVAESSRVTPWGNVTAANQNAYWTYFYGDLEAAKAAAAAGEIPTPVGRVASAAFYEGTSIPADVWIVFDKGEEIDARTLIIAGDLDGLAPTTDEAEFLPAFGQTNFLAKTEGGESVSLLCTAPRFARVSSATAGADYREIVGYQILSRSANGGYSTIAEEGQFAGDSPRQVAFDTAVLTGTNYKLVWRTTPLVEGEFAFVPRLIPDQDFTGSAIEPSVGVETVVVADDRVTLVTLVAGKDYSISYLDNTKIGTGRVIATGSGDYEGVAATNEFAIVSPNLGGMTLSGDFSDQNVPETEEAVIGDLALVDASGAAVDPSTYEVRYLDNDKPGSATAYAVGKTGEYAGRTIAARSFNVTFYPVYRVTNAAQEGGLGKSWSDPMTYANALAALAETGGEIWIAGTIELASSPASRSFTKPLGVIRGGFAGGEAKSSERIAGAVSVIDGMGSYYTLRFTNATKFELENLVFRRSRESGIAKAASNGDLVLRNCRFIENLGADGLGRNSNTYVEGTGGAGANLNGNGVARLTVENCDFSANKNDPITDTTWYDLSNGMGLFAGNFVSAALTSCTFTNNYPTGRASAGNRYGVIGVAAYIYKTAAVSFSECLFRGNRAVAPQGSVVDVSGGVSSAAFTNCLFVGNQAGGGSYNGAGFGIVRVVLSSASAPCVVKNCTVAYNLTYNKSAFVVNAGTATVSDSIFFDNISSLADYPCDFAAAGANASATVGYSLFTADSDLSLGEVSDGTLSVTEGCLYKDPLFVTTADEFKTAVRASAIGHVGWTWPGFGVMDAFDVHVRRKSPAIDTGDPKSAYRLEPSPNGHRVNLGAYGNTPWATMSPAGLMLFVR